MKKRHLFWQIYISYMLIALVSLLFITWYSTNSFKTFYYNKVYQELETNTYLVNYNIKSFLNPLNKEKLKQICQELSKILKMRITLILPSGKVLVDSIEDPSLMDNHKNRPEFKAALNQTIGHSIRYSLTIHEKQMYVAMPIKINNKVHIIVRTSLPIQFIDDAISTFRLNVIIWGFITVFIAGFISLLVTKKITSPLEILENGLKHFAAGNFKEKLPTSSIYEIERLTQAMNQMAEDLDSHIKYITRQNGEYEAVLSSMVEGVVALDSKKQIIKINNAAANLIGAKREDAKGKDISLYIQNEELISFIERSLGLQETMEANFKIGNKQIVNINAHSTTLFDINHKSIGSVIVLHDITKLIQLENIRKEFVANVSHELKTPITTIKGFVETLKDGAIEDKESANRFLEIILKHADRLNAIIEDLLDLSRLEQDSGKSIKMQPENIGEIIKSAILLCENKAKTKNIKISCQYDDSILVPLNASLFEQAIVNLIDNSIKYSYENSEVEVSAFIRTNQLLVKVKDSGIGIQKEHLSRLFERFYRTDKARSRKLGGTGLGLSIVKHIAQVHKGTVSVESNPGVGSIFSISIPISITTEPSSY